jgi:hypothetical protein
MNDEITLSDLDGWLAPELLNGYGDFNAWLLVPPAALFIIATILPLFRVPAVVAWLGFFLGIGLSFYSFWGVLFHEPQVKADAISSDYLDWFDSHYEYLGLTDSEKLTLLHNPYGFLDEKAKMNYILDNNDGTSNMKYVYYVSGEKEYSYLLAPQGADSLMDAKN